MAGSDLGTEKKLTVADAIIALTRHRVVFDPAVLDAVARARLEASGRTSASGIVKTSFPVRYEDYAEGRYDD